MYSSRQSISGCYRDYGPWAAIVLLAVGLSLAVPQPALAGTWSPTGSLNVRRDHHTATLLADGTVLVVGGGK